MNLFFVKRFFNEQKIYRRVYNELMTCTDRELSELGFGAAKSPASPSRRRVKANEKHAWLRRKQQTSSVRKSTQ